MRAPIPDDEFDYVVPAQTVIIICKKCSVLVWNKGDHASWHAGQPPREGDVLGTWLRDRLRAGLTTQSWTQAHLAQMVGISEKHLSQLLTGKVEGSISLWDRLLRLTDTAVAEVTPSLPSASGGKDS